MAYADKKNLKEASRESEGCDIKIWSGECERSNVAEGGEKYLCDVCGKIVGLDHEMHHDIFPHVSGDYDNLS